jgi:DNA polymerase-3 subunit gamma/tau
VDFAELVERMRWICREEGVEADEDALAVLALSGEGSVRDSLSALDQAIACCGKTLTGAEVRQLLGIFGMDTLGEVTAALEKRDAARMIEIVMELERSGQSLQHFCRELARYFRNLMVAKVAGANPRLIAASPAEQKRLAETAAHFSEPDLTRYLQLTLDLFRDLQYSLQPRLHLELGLVRLVQAGKLANIEEVLAGLPAAKATALTVGAGAPRERTNLVAPKVAPKAATQDAAPPPVVETDESKSLQQRIVERLLAEKRKFSADAVASAKLEENAGVLRFLAARTYTRPLQAKEVATAIQAVMGRLPKIEVLEDNTITAGPAKAAPADDGAVRQKALADPGVAAYQAAFPDAVVRGVKDLSYMKKAEE